jgi:hypothetical protein
MKMKNYNNKLHKIKNIIKTIFINILKSIQLNSSIFYIFFATPIVILILYFFYYSGFYLNLEFILCILSFIISFIISIILFKFKDSEKFSFRNIIYKFKVSIDFIFSKFKNIKNKYKNMGPQSAPPQVPQVPQAPQDNINNTKSFGLPIILNYLGITIPGDDAEPIINLAFSVFTLSLVGLFFFSIVGYLFSILILNNKNLEEKINSRPLIKKSVEYYKKSSLFFIGIDIIFCIFIFLFLIFNSLFILGIFILK